METLKDLASKVSGSSHDSSRDDRLKIVSYDKSGETASNEADTTADETDVIPDVDTGPPSATAGKRAVYEPKDFQRCKQLVCTQTKAIFIVIFLCVFILVVALIASFARPATYQSCSVTTSPAPTTSTTTAAVATNGELFPWNNIRLPDNVAPTAYRIFMHPNLTTFHFSGTVNIDFVVDKKAAKTNFLVFHSRDLNLTQIYLQSKIKRTKVNIVSNLECVSLNQVYLGLDRDLSVDTTYTLSVSFKGELSDQLEGFYKSSYKTSVGETRWLATTHFEATEARSAFPCFDEPHLKANFSMRMVREKRHISLFNTELTGTEPYGDQGLLQDSFSDSVPMSTYLVAFVVCDYKNISDLTKSLVKVSVYTPQEQLQQADLALKAANDILSFYEEFFKIPFPLKKQDLIAIPDFSAGAMENWGLITFRMTTLLADPQKSSVASQQWVVVVVAHELAHQWFGNYVTMEWWDDLWLNEGFASYMEYLGADHFRPSWKILDQFMLQSFLPAMRTDSLSNSHPISVPVSDPAQINEIFDSISYSKGACLIRMLEDFLEKETLKKGLQRYLSTHAYGNARTDDLWDAMSFEAEDTHLDVSNVMSTWTQQMGYPVITMTRQKDTLTVNQERFLLNPNAKDTVPSPHGYKWQIPLRYKTQAENGIIWLRDDSDKIYLKHTPLWIKLNVNQMGFYRVNYDDENWRQLIDLLHTMPTQLSDSDRAGLLDDVFALSRSGRLPTTVALNLTTYLYNEEQYVPWAVGLANIHFIGEILRNKPAYTDYKTFLTWLISDQLEKIGWEDIGSHLDKNLRYQLLSNAVELDHVTSVTQASKMFSDWMKSGKEISPNLKTVAYHAGIANGGEREWNFVWDQFQKSTIPTEKVKLLRALATTKDPMILQRFLEMSLDESKVRKGDTTTVIRGVVVNPVGRLFAWRFIKQNWDTLFQRYGAAPFVLSGLVQSLAVFSTDYDKLEAADFFELHPVGVAKRAVSQMLESVQMNIDWLDRNEEAVTDWLAHKAASIRDNA